MRKKFKSANELFCWFLWWCLSLRRPKLAFVKQLCQWELEWNQHLFQEKLDKRKNESVVPIRDVTKSIFLWIYWLDSMKSWFRFVTAPPREVKKSTWYRKKILHWGFLRPTDAFVNLSGIIASWRLLIFGCWNELFVRYRQLRSVVVCRKNLIRWIR